MECVPVSPTCANEIALEGITTLAVVLFLMVAGIEVDLSTVWRRGKVALKVGIAGILIPFLLGLLAAWLIPRVLGRQAEADPLIFALFLGTALSISSLPVIAKTMMDLDLYRSDLGMVVVSAAIFNDLIGWTMFAAILSLVDGASGRAASIPLTIGLILAFAAAMLTIGRWLIDKILPYLQAYTHGPAGVLGFVLTLAMLGAAFTEWIGIHAVFGAFLVGVAVGDSSHLHERTRTITNDFVAFIFAPLFFASIGLKVNFATHFDATLVVTVLLIACAGKLACATLGARWGGMPPRDAWAVGFGMNARGAMEIILGLLALEAGVIRERLFVALVITALVTSMMSGPIMQSILQLRKPWHFLGVFSSKAFRRKLAAASRREAVQELTAAACAAAKLDVHPVEDAVWAREEAVPTGIGKGVALPHARLSELREPLVTVGMSEAGIDFDAPDGELAHVIFLILTPVHDPSAQLKIATELSRLFQDRQMLAKVLRVNNFAEFMALMKTATTGMKGSSLRRPGWARGFERGGVIVCSRFGTLPGLPR